MKLKILGIAIVAIVLVFIGSKTTNEGLGSIQGDGGYSATTTSASFNNRLAVVKKGPTLLGSVTITGANNAVMTIKDATSTTDTASTTVVVIAANTISGTYTFDAQLTRGLGIDTPGTWSSGYTVTFK